MRKVPSAELPSLTGNPILQLLGKIIREFDNKFTQQRHAGLVLNEIKWLVSH